MSTQDDVAGERDYDVGYGKPPKHSRWKKGQPSPNPGGRPKHCNDVQKVVERIANEPIRGRTQGSPFEVPTQEAVYLRQVEAAMHGDQRAAAFVIREMKRCDLIVQRSPDDGQQRGFLGIPSKPTDEQYRRYLAAVRRKHIGEGYG